MQIAKDRIIQIFSRLLSFLPNRLLRFLKISIDCSLGYGSGGFDYKNEVSAIRHLLSDTSNPIVFDIGANRGDWAKEFLEQVPGASMFCFEPDPSSEFEIMNNVGVGRDITIYNIALSNVSGTTSLFTTKALWGGASIVPNEKREGYSTFEVPVTTLDDFVANNLFFPDVIKIDVEGAEMLVLLGGKRTLQTTRIVEFEFGTNQFESKLYFKDFFEFFTSCGFEIGRITPNGLKPVQLYDPIEEYFRTTNWLAYRKLIRAHP